MRVVLRALTEADSGWRKPMPHEVGYEHRDHRCSAECEIWVTEHGYKRRYNRHPYRAPTDG